MFATRPLASAFADRRDDEALFTAFVKAVLRSHRTNATYHRLMLFAALENHLAGLRSGPLSGASKHRSARPRR
jgi:hypothetical protein